MYTQREGVVLTKPVVGWIVALLPLFAGCGNGWPGGPRGGSSGPDPCVDPDGCAIPPATPSEGGSVLLEDEHLDTDLQTTFQLPSGVTTLVRATAYFMDDQTPQANPLPVQGACNDLEKTHGWPYWVGTPHTDLDVGTVTIRGPTGASTMTSLELAKQPAGTDFLGRPHDIFYQALAPDAANYFVPDAAYDVILGGAGTIPATTFAGRLFTPGDVTVNTPDLEDDGPLVAGTDYTVHWMPVGAQPSPANAQWLGVTWLLTTNGAPAIMCPTVESADQFTIPGDAIQAYEDDAAARGTDPTHLILLRQAFGLALVRLPNGEPTNVRRIDLITAISWAQLMNVQ